MNTRMDCNAPRQSGFVLATVLVFLVVLSLTAFFAARMTRANTQVVNNLGNEKQAFYVAEAGVHEALYRMSLASPACVTISGISGGGAGGCTGNNFDASIAPRVTGSTGRSSFGINDADVNTITEILLNTSAPTTSGVYLKTPTLQPAASRLPYSQSTADETLTPLTLTQSSRLTIGWDVCTDTAPNRGCSAPNTIRQLPISKPRPVAKIVSTGEVRRTDNSVVASRKLTVWASDSCEIENIAGNGSILTTGTACGDGIRMTGSGGSITAAGAVQVNAGPSSSCGSAIDGGGGSCSPGVTPCGIQAASISTVGDVSGSPTKFTPDATTGGVPVSDPYAVPNLYPPCYTGVAGTCGTGSASGCPATGGGPGCAGNPITNASVCSGTDLSGGSSDPANPALCTAGGSAVLNPGIYYGGIRVTGTNVTMNPGIYIIAAGGFDVDNATITGSGVMVYNTSDPAATQANARDAGSFDLSSGGSDPRLVSPASGNPYSGFVLFQDRNLSPQPTVRLQGGTNTAARLLDGIVYAPGAQLEISGTNPVNVAGSIIVQSMNVGGNSPLNIANASNPPPGNQCAGAAYKALAWQDFL